MRARPFLSRQERFQSVESTNDVVRSWLTAGTAEVCLAAAAEQTAGRGRAGRSWQAPRGAGLLLSLGFRPTYLPADRMWRLPAVVALAMCDAAEEVAGLPVGLLRLKWPNDVVVETGGELRKLAGVLGETEGVGTAEPAAVVGIGLNCNWPRNEFPEELAGAMASLSDLAGRPVDSEALLDGFLARLEPRVAALSAGMFDVAGWHERQATTGHAVRLESADGEAVEVLAVGVDGATGGLIVADCAGGEEREVLAGEVARVRLARSPSRAAAGSEADCEPAGRAPAGRAPAGRNPAGVTP